MMPQAEGINRWQRVVSATTFTCNIISISWANRWTRRCTDIAEPGVVDEEIEVERPRL